MNFKGEIVDFISQSDSAVIQAVHKRDINERMETFDFTILSERTTHMQERNRIIIQDKNGQYREFIIDRISADIDGYTEVETVASYLEDITKARPYTPGKLEKMTTKQALSDVLKDTGWEVSDATEYGGLRTTSWTSYQTRYDVLLQLCTTYGMMADFYIEVGSNRVDKRLVVLRKRNPLFKGKEITYGKDLTGLKRIVDFSEIKTALLCVGPEPEEGKKRVELVVKDDESQAKYGLPGRYNWGIYEPETEDQNMTEKRLRTLGTTELNKRKSEGISYEVTAIDIEKEYKHEIVNLGDLVRIKNRDFTPPLYVEAEVISEEYDLISKDVTYGFGTYKEFKESDLRSSFDRKIDAIRQKLSDGLSNVNTIVKESIEGELQYFERKILKGDTPPEKPVNDLLWLDTSNPKVAVLRRYWNGEWIKSSAENASDVGAVTREQALYSELSNTFVNLTIQHSRLIHEVSDVLESEYLVDTDIKAKVNSKLNDTIGVFNEIKQSLDSMTSETATIGKLVDTQALFLQYREKMQALYNTIENAKIAIDERFKLLQSQYTDEKYNEAMEKIASALPGGNWNAETGQLTGDIPNEERLNELEIGLQETFASQINGANQLLKNQVDAELLQLKDEITLSVHSVNEKIDGLGDGVNLLDSYNSSRPVSINKDIVSTKSFQGEYYATKLYTADYLKTILIPGETYTYSYEMEIVGLSEKEVPYTKKHGIIFYSSSVAKDRIMSYQDVERTIGNKIKYTRTFVAPVITDHRFVAYAGFYTDDGTLKYPISSNLVEITNFKLERGTKATPYTESINDRLEPIKIRTTEAENSIKVLQDSLLLTATKEDVQRTLDDQLKPLKNEVNEQKAQLQIMSDSIDSKVSQSDYTTDRNGIVERLNSADSQRQQLSNQISDRVTISEYQSGIEDTKQQINSKIDSISIGGENILDGTKNFTAPFLTNLIEKYGLRTNGELISLDYDSENNRIAWTTRQLNIDVLPNTDYTLSYDAKTHDGIEQGVAYTPIMRLQDDGSQFNPSKYIATGDTYKNTTNEFKRYSFTFNTGETKKINIYYTSKNVNSLVQIKKVKLEQGNKVTSYSESQNDINERIVKVQSDAEMSAKAYADAQDALRKTEAQAYVDGIVSAEEQRAIADAQAKLEQAKKDAKAKADNAENLAKQHANTVSTNAETKAKAYADSKVQQVNQTLTTHETRLTQNGKDIALRATQEELNASKKTLSRVIADLTVNTTTGLTLSYDENGSIQSHTVGPDGIKLDTSKFVINDGDVIVQNGITTIKDAYIDKLFSKQATIEYLKATDIDLNRATISGSKDGESTVLSGGKIRSTGSFARTFPQGSVTYEAFTESWNGVYRSGLISKQFGNRKLTNIERWLALTDKTITTQREIHSMSPDKRGARFIDFFAEETYSSDVFGQGMHVYSGQDLKIEAGYRLSFESSNSWYTQFLSGGVEVVNDGASLVLKRQSGFTSQAGIGGQYIILQAYDGAEHGHLGILSNNRHLSLKSSFGEVHLRGNQVKALNSEGTSLTSITASDFDISGVGRVAFENGDAYLQGQTGVRFTRYKSNTFITAQAKDFVKASSRYLKTNIEDLKDGLETIKKLTPVKYDYISDLQEGNTDGDIGFIAEDSPSISVNNGKAISVQKIATWAILGIQELSKENKELQEEIADLKSKFDILSEVIK